MAKRKKTRQQKIIADLRRRLQMEKRSAPSEIPSVITSSPAKPDDEAISSIMRLPRPDSIRTRNDNYSYLFYDLSKTGILTGGIIIAQLVLLFLLKNHIVILPMVKY